MIEYEKVIVNPSSPKVDAKTIVWLLASIKQKHLLLLREYNYTALVTPLTKKTIYLVSYCELENYCSLLISIAIK